MSKALNKDAFSEFLRRKFGVSTKTEAKKIIEYFCSSLLEAVSKGNKVSITGFGSFEAQERASRMGRNPRTGAAMKIDAYKQPMFKAGQKFKDTCNGR